MRVSVLQFAPVRGDVSANIKAVSGLVRDDQAELLVIPELASTGYFFTEPKELLDLVDVPEHDRFVQWMRGHAADRKSVVVGGFAERTADDRLYNSAAIALPDGRMEIYRKAHLFYKEGMVFQPGDSGFFVVEWEGMRIGTMICYDWRFPEAIRSLALAGADVVAHPSNLVVSASIWGPVMSTRAFENRVICATANRFGVEVVEGEAISFTGESRIVQANGDILAIAEPAEECVLRAEVDHQATRRKSFNPYNDIFADRRPELYRL